MANSVKANSVKANSRRQRDLSRQVEARVLIDDDGLSKSDSQSTERHAGDKTGGDNVKKMAGEVGNDRANYQNYSNFQH